MVKLFSKGENGVEYCVWSVVDGAGVLVVLVRRGAPLFFPALEAVKALDEMLNKTAAGLVRLLESSVGLVAWDKNWT